jgi:hypothetical protein
MTFERQIHGWTTMVMEGSGTDRPPVLALVSLAATQGMVALLLPRFSAT